MSSSFAAQGFHNHGFSLNEIKKRNRILYYYGLLNFIASVMCLALMIVDDRQVAGMNTWIKPFKFYISIGIFCWTISWYLVYLQRRKAVKWYSIAVIITMMIEMGIITYQAARGVKSHFNISTPADGMLFSVMGVSILIFTAWTLYVFILFSNQKAFPVHEGYYWGIKMGLLMFVIFALEGGLMASLLRHTIGAEDGSEGLPLLNWSRQFGDLRVAHFFGMHALQVIPLAGYYFFKSRPGILLFSVAYFVLVMLLFLRAMQGVSLL